MARKRLSPTPILPNAGEAPAERAEDATPRTRRAPIADVAQNSATSSALEEMAETLRRARDEGRMVLSLPLEVVDHEPVLSDHVELVVKQDLRQVEPEGAPVGLSEILDAGNQSCPEPR